jgi:hypothetical protein
MYFLYVKSSLSMDFVFRKKYSLHFFPAILLFINYIPYYSFLAGINKSITAVLATGRRSRLCDWYGHWNGAL